MSKEPNHDEMDSIQEYQERYRFWTDKRISQLSFHNNLMLTLGIALIVYFWAERDSVYTEIIIDWKVFLFFAGILSVGVSIFSGFLLSLSRLYDLRLTSNIVLTRKRLIKKGIKLKEERLSQTKFWRSIKSLCGVWRKYQNYEITKGDLDDHDCRQDKFTKIRQKSNDLGRSTWGLLTCQTICMFVAVVLFIFVLIVK